MRTMKALSLALVAVLAAAPALADTPTRWLNIDIQESHDGADVAVRLPIGLILGVLDAVDSDELQHGKIDLHVDDADIDWPALLKAVRSAPDGEWVTIRDNDADIKVVKAGGTVVIDIAEHEHDGAVVKVTLPASILDAVDVDADNRLDLRSLLDALALDHVGDLVRVTSPDANIRVWIE